MDITQVVATTTTTSLISAVVGAVVASVISAAKNAKRGHDDMALAQQEAIKLLVMDKAKQRTHEAVKAGEITLEDRAFIKALTKCAHQLGANGEMSACDAIVDELPTSR